MRKLAATAVALQLVAGPTLAQDPGPAAASGGQSLDQAANDPTASLMSVQVQNVYAGDYHILDGETGNTLLLRAAVPFETGELNHIARLTVPVVTDSPSRESGLGDIVLFDLLAFDESWGRWGIGPVLLAPTATDDSLGADKWAIGPALGFVARAPGLLWGVFKIGTAKHSAFTPESSLRRLPSVLLGMDRAPLAGAAHPLHAVRANRRRIGASKGVRCTLSFPSGASRVP